MEMLYTSRGIYNFLDVNMGDRRDVEEAGLMYKVRMLEKNQISCLISPFENEVDGNFYLRYNTESNYVMDRLMQKIKPDGEFLELIIHQLLQCINDSVAYLLNPDDIVINPAYMFFDYAQKKLRLICVPGYDKNITGQLRDFLEYIMRIFDHRDQAGVKLLYELYEQVTEENFSLYEYGRLQKDRLLNLTAKEKEVQQVKKVQENSPQLSDAKNVQQIREVRSEISYDDEMKEKPDKGGVLVAVIFAVSLAAGAKYILDGRNSVWLAACIAGFAMSAVSMLSVLSRTRDEREIDESMMAYATVGADVAGATDMPGRTDIPDWADMPGGTGMSGGANVTGKSGGASQGALLHTGMMRLVPLNNGCLAPLEISGKKRELSIGRGKIENDYRLSGSQISRVHARVYMKDGDVYLRDAGSTNGTFVNSVRLGENEEIKLNRGDVVAFATEEFFVS